MKDARRDKEGNVEKDGREGERDNERGEKEKDGEET